MQHPASFRFRQFLHRHSWPLALCAVLVIGIPLVIAPDISHHQGQATLAFSKIDGPVAVGQVFPVSLTLHSSASINAVGIHLTYDPNQLDIIQMTTQQSFCSFYTENTFDTIKGEVEMSCGTPNPGFSGDSVILTLTIRAKNSGAARLTLDPKQTEILANNGTGTNLLNKPPHLDVSIAQTF